MCVSIIIRNFVHLKRFAGLKMRKIMFMTKQYKTLFFCGLMAITQLSFAQKITVGQYTFKDGSVYNGQLTNGKPNGKGKTVFLTGDTYEGEYLKAKRHGEGTYAFVDGEKYEVRG